MENNQRKGDWLQTYLGIQFWPLDPRPEEIDIRDIAHSLSLMCRFAGHTRCFYSVAQHSCLVSDFLILEDLALCGLLHDASEAYLVDLPRPIKNNTQLGECYAIVEKRNMECIAKKFQLENIIYPAVENADNVLLATEARDLMGPHPAAWECLPEPLKEIIEPWSPAKAEWEFLTRYNRLFK